MILKPRGTNPLVTGEGLIQCRDEKTICRFSLLYKTLLAPTTALNSRSNFDNKAVTHTLKLFRSCPPARAADNTERYCSKGRHGTVLILGTASISPVSSMKLGTQTRQFELGKYRVFPSNTSMELPKHYYGGP